jgi:hypothetical protein
MYNDTCITIYVDVHRKGEDLLRKREETSSICARPAATEGRSRANSRERLRPAPWNTFLHYSAQTVLQTGARREGCADLLLHDSQPASLSKCAAAAPPPPPPPPLVGPQPTRPAITQAPNGTWPFSCLQDPSCFNEGEGIHGVTPSLRIWCKGGETTSTWAVLFFAVWRPSLVSSSRYMRPVHAFRCSS